MNSVTYKLEQIHGCALTLKYVKSNERSFPNQIENIIFREVVVVVVVVIF